MPAYRARDVRSQPSIDAGDMEVMFAQGQQPQLLAFLVVAQAHNAVVDGAVAFYRKLHGVERDDRERLDVVLFQTFVKM